jgi:hypothetical protein
MMIAVTAAACGQTRIVLSPEGRRERPQRKKGDQEDGKHAPHLDTMLHQPGMVQMNRE